MKNIHISGHGPYSHLIKFYNHALENEEYSCTCILTQPVHTHKKLFRFVQSLRERGIIFTFFDTACIVIFKFYEALSLVSI